MTARKVMIVEDEMLVRLHLERTLSGMGHEVIATASTAAEAIEQASRSAPELVLMDIRLPGKRDGISAAKEIRERFGCGVIFATAHADEEILARAASVEASGYLVKPFTSTEVRATVQTALSRLPQRRAEISGRETGGAESRQTLRRPFGSGTRMLVYSHDTLGMGHLQRSLKLIRAVMEHHPQISLLLVTGSPVVHRYELPLGADYVKLPAVQKVGSNDYASRSLSMSGSDVRDLRSNLLLRIVHDYDPNVLLVDHSPAGMQGELLPSLEWLSERTSCRKILGLRDVTDDAAEVRDAWERQRIYPLLERCYDDIVVYGDRHVYDCAREYRLSDEVAERLRYLGYVCDREESAEPALPRKSRKPRIAISIGGGDGASEMILAYLAMIRRFGSELDADSEILTGPLIGEEEKRRIHAQAEGLSVAIHEFMPTTTRLFAEADLVIATAGYNTTTQLLAHARRALLVPRVMHRREQLVRARRLEALGLVRCLHPRDILPERFFREVRDALAEPQAALSEARKRGTLPLDGAERFADFCSGISVQVPIGFAGNGANPDLPRREPDAELRCSDPETKKTQRGTHTCARKESGIR